MLICRDGLKICEFKLDEQGINNERSVKLEETDWKVPIDARGKDAFELGKRVRFEANNIIRYLTDDDLDILFLLSEDGSVRKISEVQLENFAKTDGPCKHQLTTKHDTT